MAWRETERAAAVPIRRTYRCTDCGTQFVLIHEDSAEIAVDCPACTTPAEYQVPNPGILTSKSVALDMVHRMSEEDYGMTNMRDNLKVGETAFMGPAPIQTAEKEVIVRELVQAGVTAQDAVQIADPNLQAQSREFFSGQGLGGLGMMDVARPASAAAASLGTDPVGLLEAGRKTGSMKMNLDIANVAPTKGRKRA